MRKAINENPMVQMIVIGVMLVIGVFLLFTMVLKKDEPVVTDPAAAAQKAAEKAGIAPTATSSVGPDAGTDTATTDPAATDSAPVDPAATGTAPVDPATPAPATPAPDASAAAADGLLPTKGLPKDVLIAYAKGDTVALLVIDSKAATDKQLKYYTELASSSRNDVALFIVDVKDIAKYSRITSGVAVSRAPALVVVRPRKLTDNVPTASVSYGFRSPSSVEQALEDARFDGQTLPSYP